MENTIQINPIGVIRADKKGFIIELDKSYRLALTNLEGFSHLQIIWWGNLYDKPENRANLIINKPYKNGPDKLGVFGTRSPVRPNPILLSTIYVQQIDVENGLIITPYIDAEPGTPVLDIKPYLLHERIKSSRVPNWCSHWPQWYEDSATFDWQNEFNF